MRMIIFIVLLFFSPPGPGAILHIDNQSNFLAVVLNNIGGHPCTPYANTEPPCLIPPHSHFVHELVDDEPANATLHIISMPSTQTPPGEALDKYAFKSFANFTYRPLGPLKYEQLTCTTPANEGITIQLILEGVTQVACDTTNTRGITWIYKRNDIPLKFILSDVPTVKNPRQHLPPQ